MVRDFLASTIAVVRKSWQALSQCAAAVFPPEPPPSVPYPLVPRVNWSLSSVQESGSLNPDDPIQAALLQTRRRFIAGTLFCPLAKVSSRGVVIVSRITEKGAINAEHMLVLIPFRRESTWKTETAALSRDTTFHGWSSQQHRARFWANRKQCLQIGTQKRPSVEESLSIEGMVRKRPKNGLPGNC